MVIDKSCDSDLSNNEFQENNLQEILNDDDINDAISDLSLEGKNN